MEKSRENISELKKFYVDVPCVFLLLHTSGCCMRAFAGGVKCSITCFIARTLVNFFVPVQKYI